MNWGNVSYEIDGFNQINWSDGTNGTKCVRIDRAAGSVWFHWMKLSDRIGWNERYWIDRVDNMHGQKDRKWGTNIQ